MTELKSKIWPTALPFAIAAFAVFLYLENSYRAAMAMAFFAGLFANKLAK